MAQNGTEQCFQKAVSENMTKLIKYIEDVFNMFCIEATDIRAHYATMRPDRAVTEIMTKFQQLKGVG
jgi:hypothetical protein